MDRTRPNQLPLADRSNTISNQSYQINQAGFLEQPQPNQKKPTTTTTATQILNENHSSNLDPFSNDDGSSTSKQTLATDDLFINRCDKIKNNNHVIMNKNTNAIASTTISKNDPANTSEPYIDGWLYKWTNYIKLYQKRWFVLEQGLLSYYRNPSDTGLTCRGNISLTDASIQAEEGNNFFISNGHQIYHLRANNEIERQRWIMMLELAKTKQPITIDRNHHHHGYHLLSASTDSPWPKTTTTTTTTTTPIPNNLNNVTSTGATESPKQTKSSSVIRSSSNVEKRHSDNDKKQRSIRINDTDSTIRDQPNNRVQATHDSASEEEEEEDEEDEISPMMEYLDEKSPIRDILEISTKDLTDKLVHLKQQALVFNECTSKFANSLLQLYSSQAQTMDHLNTDHCTNVSLSSSSTPSTTSVSTKSSSQSANILENQQKLFSNILKNVTMVQEALDGVTTLSRNYVKTAEEHQQKWTKSIVRDQNNRAKLEDLVEQLARQQSEYEEEFFDAEDESQQEPHIASHGDNILYVSRPGGALRIQSPNTTSTTTTTTTNNNNSIKHKIPAKIYSKAKSLRSTNLSDEKDNRKTSEISDDNDQASSLHPSRDLAPILIEDHKPSLSQQECRKPPVDIKTGTINNKQDIEYAITTTDSEQEPHIEQPINTSSAIIKKDMGKRTRRTVIPHRLNQSLHLWSFMKNCVGKELTKIPIPVNFNEPLSMLQRLTEDYEYAHELLHSAAKLSDPLEQLIYVSVFAVTSYSTTSNRTGKPFNPLLGETYECDRRDDLGWRCINEQVCHHPPMMASFCEGKGWIAWREFGMTSKFRGKYLQVTPQDFNMIEIGKNKYVWKKVDTCVHNVIVGKLWVDNAGEMVITNHTTGDKCKLNFTPYSYFSKGIQKKVSGFATDKNDKPLRFIDGTWDTEMRVSNVIHSTAKSGSQTIETGDPTILWKRREPGPEYEKMYNMTKFAVQLNELEDGVAPTDSRLRPDQRLMEIGKWDDSNRVKCLLEEKQRATRRNRETSLEDPTNSIDEVRSDERKYSNSVSRQNNNGSSSPGSRIDEDISKDGSQTKVFNRNSPLDGPYWFKKELDPVTKKTIHRYTHEYWQCKEQQDWSRCPDIFIKMDI